MCMPMHCCLRKNDGGGDPNLQGVGRFAASKGVPLSLPAVGLPNI